MPTEQKLEQTRARVGYQHLQLNRERNMLSKARDVYIDLSAIAKGYAVDRVAELLLAKGWRDFMVEIGGELRLSGNSARGTPWRIGVEKPSLFQAEVLQAITLSRGGVATSGDYRNYREVDGVRVGHTIDPSSGRPVVHNLASVTVIADTAAEADALATAILVMGPQEGFEFAESRNLAAYFIVSESKGFDVNYTRAFEQYKVSL